MSAAHTPGPWVFHKRAQRIYGGSWQGAKIAQMGIIPEWEANARLIAAAPALLEALDFMVNVSRSTPGFSAMAREQAERALSLAKGESA